jgi:hypothetical protein
VKKSLLGNKTNLTAENTDYSELCLFKNETLHLQVSVDSWTFQGPENEVKKGILSREATVSLRRTMTEWLPVHLPERRELSQ